MTDEFPPFVTVLRQRDNFYAAIMTWDRKQERYELSPNHMRGRLRQYKTDASIDADFLAEKLGVEVRL